MLALKFLNEDGTGTYSGFAWPMPTDTKPGRWVFVKGDLEPCHNGIHAATMEQAMEWLAPTAYIIELGGKVIDNGDKLVARKGRLVRKLDTWNERNQRLLACDFAEHVLPIFEKAYPKDDRPRTAIVVARRYANGEASKQERDAAGDAAGAAAWDAAWDAARAAAGDAARAAAGAAAGAAERQWQSGRLAVYLDAKELS